jgi:archaemetzincin
MKYKSRKDAFCTVYVLMSDIYSREDWNYVYGLASLYDKVGCFSFARYDKSFWREEPLPME